MISSIIDPYFVFQEAEKDRVWTVRAWSEVEELSELQWSASAESRGDALDDVESREYVF